MTPIEPLTHLGPCAACRFFVRQGPRTFADMPRECGEHEGQCRHGSPRVNSWPQRWPKVREDEGCGQFKPTQQDAPDAVPHHHG